MKRLLIIFAALTALSTLRAEIPAGATVAAVEFSGNHAFKDDELLKEVGFKVGDVYTPDGEHVAARLIRAYYQRHGYLDAEVAGSTAPAPGAVRVRLTITEGALYHFGDIHVEGLRTLPERLIHLEGTFKPGEPYVRSKLFDMQSNLYAKGLFDNVEITASTTSAKTADVVVRVKERRLKWIKGGVGWGSEERERLSLIFLHENLGRRLFRTEFTNTWTSIWKEHRLDFVNPYFFETRTEQRTSVSWRKENREGYDFERTRGEASLGRNLTRVLKGTVGLRWDRNIVYNVTPAVAATTPDRSDSRTVAVGLSRDTSNDFFFPSRGSRSTLSAERMGGFLGGLINMHRVTFDNNVYQPLGRKLVLALALRSGYSQEFAGTEDVPVFERFFIGGANSIRGYDERDVGPHDETNAPLGGTRRLGSSVELRFPLFWKLRGAAFVDGGQVGNQWNDVQLNDWKYSAGGGIRLITPVGPFRLDAGYKLNRDPGDLETWRLHFSLGEAF